ncbi:hypothetical protein GCM10028801_46130 [Nocardioides maradonensis]
MRRPVAVSAMAAVFISSLTVLAMEPRSVASATPAAEVMSSPDAVSAARAARAEGHRVEDMSSRSEYSQTFANADGTWTTESTTEPQFVQAGDGSWQDIDTTLTVRDGRLEPRAALADVSLSDGGDSTFADINQEGRQLDWRWPTQLPEPTIDGSAATYANAVPGGGDLVVTATATGFTHDIVLDSAPAAAIADPTGQVSYTMPVATHGASLDTTKSGGVDVSVGSDSLVTAPAPLAFDAAGDPGDGAAEAPVDVQVGKNAAGTPTMTLNVDSGFLTDPSTVYPVTIDPSYTINASSDTYVSKSNPNTDYSGQTALLAGDNAGNDVARTYLHFNFGAPNYMAGKQILSATLKMQNFDAHSCAGSQINVNRVTSSWGSLTWNTQPSYTTEGTASFNPAYGYSANCPSAQASWDVTNIVSYWAAHQGENYGLRVKAADESDPNSWRRYRALDSQMDTVLPRMSVTYNTAPDGPSELSITPSRGNVTASLTPTLQAKVADFDLGQLTAKFRIFDESGNLVATLDSDGPVASGGTATAAVPDGLLEASTAYSFDVQASDDYLSSAYSTRSTFRVDPALTTIPAPACVSPCSPVTDQVLLDEVIPGVASKVVPIQIPGVDQGSVDRVQVTVTITDWSATGSVTIADTDYAATDPASLPYGGGQAATGTAEVFPSYDDDSITLANNGAAPVHLRVLLNAWIPVDTTNDATLDASENYVDDAAAEAAIEDDSSDYEDVLGTTSVVTAGASQVAMVQPDPTPAEATVPDASTTYPCPQDDDANATCSAEIASEDMSSNDVTDSEADLADPPPSPEASGTDRVMARSIGIKCFENAGHWVARTRFTACQVHAWILTIYRYIKGVKTKVGTAHYITQYLLKTDWQHPHVEMWFRAIWKRGDGAGLAINVSFDLLCASGCADNNDVVRNTGELAAYHPKSAWYSGDVYPSVAYNQVVTPKFAFVHNTCDVIGCQNEPLASGVDARVVRCDRMAYIQTANPGCVVPGYRPTLKMSRYVGNTVETATHIYKAQNKLSNHPGKRLPNGLGYPLTRTYGHGYIKLNRREAHRECASLHGSGSCDEYPFASTRQGCALMKCDVDLIDLDDNKAGGRLLNSELYRPYRVLDADAFWVSVS